MYYIAYPINIKIKPTLQTYEIYNTTLVLVYYAASIEIFHARLIRLMYAGIQTSSTIEYHSS